MSVYDKANRLSYALAFAELALVAVIINATDWPVRLIATGFAVATAILLFAYPRCPTCGLNPWFRKVSQDRWYAVTDYMPLGTLQKTCARCERDLTKDSQ